MGITKLLNLIILIFSFTVIPVLAVNDKLDTSNKELLHIIAESNRKNRKLIESFDCNYAFTMSQLKSEKDSTNEIISKEGRYAFSGDKVYSMDKIQDKNFYLQYVSNGSKMMTSAVSKK